MNWQWSFNTAEEVSDHGTTYDNIEIAGNVVSIYVSTNEW